MSYNISDSAFHGVFNARWLSPEQVARQFVPIGQFTKLTHSRHSLLLGPRGSGKTTLLKMLTRRALEVWYSERRDDSLPPPFERPAFEAIYIPSDVRWSYELRHIGKDGIFPAIDTELSQRVLVGGSALVALCDAFEWRVGRLPIKKQKTVETAVSEAIIDLYGLDNTLPLFGDIKASVESLTGKLRGILNRRDPRRLQGFLEPIPDFMFSHVVDGPISTCKLFDRFLPASEPRATTWALCFDELEIAPAWMRQEILESFRSIDQAFLIKATYSPLLPTGIRTAPEPAQDFQRIRLWHSHVKDARLFCEDLAARFLKEKFPDEEVTPNQFLRYSALASGQPSEVDDPTSYERDSSIYFQMRQLAQADTSFADLLRSRGLAPEDPYSDDPELRDIFFRKIKPVVILRVAFLQPGRGRSRKVYTVYAGKESVYAMSEGNPRWLLGLLTDLHDRWLITRDRDDGRPLIKYNEQAKILSATARRYHASLAATPIDEVDSQGTRASLIDLLDSIGQAIQEQLLGRQFPLDPYGSFKVDDAVSPLIHKLMGKALETGAVVYIGASEEDVPQQIEGSRFRLSFMLSPVYKLAFRNYRELLLSTLLARTGHPDQLNILGTKEPQGY